MLVENLVMEACIADSKAGKFASVSVRILAALNSSLNQSVLEKFLIEVASVTAQISNQVTDFGSNTRVIMADKRVKVNVDVCVMNGLIELFRDASKL